MANRGSGVHTTPNPDGKGWVNQTDGKIISTHRLKERAVERGREIAQAEHTEHTIHNTNGQIGRKNSYGNDPNPPRDRNR